VFQLSPSDADPCWYLGKFVGIVGVIYNLLIAIGVDLVPSSRIDFMFGILLLALVPMIEGMSDSTPLYKEIDFENE
jgi:cadmium resistance protein CadD (predicted permease)